MFDSDYLHCLESSGLTSQNIILKRHAVIVIVSNLYIAGGHLNGKRHTILEVTSNFIIAKKLNGAEDYVIFIPKILCKRDETDFRFAFIRLQFSFMVAYYLTFN